MSHLSSLTQGFPGLHLENPAPLFAREGRRHLQVTWGECENKTSNSAYYFDEVKTTWKK